MAVFGNPSSAFIRTRVSGRFRFQDYAFDFEVQAGDVRHSLADGGKAGNQMSEGLTAAMQ